MGCGASKNIDVADNNNCQHPNQPFAKQQPVTTQKVEVKPTALATRQPLEPIRSIKDNADLCKKGFTAFEVSLNARNTNNSLNSQIGTLLSRPIVGRNTMLEPIAHKTPVTNSEFEDPEIERKRKAKQRKLSRRRTELKSARRRALGAMDYDEEEDEVNIREDPAMAAEILESKMTHAERMREIKLLEIQEKQRLREERGRLARERVQQIKMSSEADFEGDETYELGRKRTMTKRDDDDYHQRSQTPPTPTPHNNSNVPLPENKLASALANTSTTTITKSPRTTTPDTSSGYNTREVSASSQADTAMVDLRTGNNRRVSPHKSPITDERTSSNSEFSYNNHRTSYEPSHNHKAAEWDLDDDEDETAMKGHFQEEHSFGHRVGLRVEADQQRYGDEDEFY